uniref:Uncharacterized protein n=1 Tax=Anopheles gambiae TaxID=7165 RepID=A0A0E4G8M8_ANOGA
MTTVGVGATHLQAERKRNTGSPWPWLHVGLLGLIVLCVVGSLLTPCDGAGRPASLADSPVYFGGIVPANGRFGKKIQHFPNTDRSLHPLPAKDRELHHAERDRADDA